MRQNKNKEIDAKYVSYLEKEMKETKELLLKVLENNQDMKNIIINKKTKTEIVQVQPEINLKKRKNSPKSLSSLWFYWYSTKSWRNKNIFSSRQEYNNHKLIVYFMRLIFFGAFKDC